MKRILIMIAVAVFSASTVFAEGPAMWATVSATKKITKKWDVSAEAELRTHYGFDGGIDRVSLSVGTDYEIFSFLKIGVGYVFMNCHSQDRITRGQNFVPDYWYLRHRVNASLTGEVSFGDFSISLRERWQYTYRPEKYVPKFEEDFITPKNDELVKGKGKNVLRSRLELEYNIRSIKLSPYVSAEMYHSGSGLDKVRYTAGAKYKITKKHALELFYRYQDQSDEDDPDGHIIGIEYKFKF